jgi:hypothetical protein
MTAVLIILAVVLLLVMAWSLFGTGAGPTQRRVVVRRPARRRRVVEEVVDDRPATRYVEEDPTVTRRVVE